MSSKQRQFPSILSALLLPFVSVFALAATNAPNSLPLNLSGRAVDAFGSPAKARVFLFVRTDCPVGNRYAPELQRISNEFTPRGVQFWLVYPDATETAPTIQKHIGDYHLPGTPLRDVHHSIVARSGATVAPEAAVFNSAGKLEYLGRIDDRWVDFGKSRPAPTTHELENAVADVLAGKPVPVSRTHAIGCSIADVE